MYWYPISDNMLDIAEKRYADRLHPRSDMKTALKSYLIASYGVYKALKTIFSDTINESLAVLADLTARYDVRLLWISDSVDADLSSERARDLAEKLKKYEISRCFIPQGDRLPRDGHPNARGYDVLKDCVEKSLRNW
jgi:hypothetical protein